MRESNWYQIQKLTIYCSHSACPISNPFLAQEQLVLDLDTHALFSAFPISNPRLAREQLVLDLDTHHLLFTLRICHQQSISCTWHQIQTLTCYCSRSASAINNPFLAQKQLVVDLDTHGLLFPLRICDQQSISCDWYWIQTLTIYRSHSAPLISNPFLHKSNWYQIQTLTVCCSRMSDQQSVPCTREIGTRFRHSHPIVPTPHLRSAIHSLLKSNWYYIQTLTIYCSHSASAISNSFLAQEQLVLDLDTHNLLFPLRISNQQSILCTRATGTRFRHSLTVVPTPHLRSVIHSLHKSNWYQIQTLTVYCSHSASAISNPSIAYTRAIGTRFRHSLTIVLTPHLRSATHLLLTQEQLVLDLNTH